MRILRGREERISWVLRRREERKTKAAEKKQLGNAEDWREVRMEGRGKGAQSVKREMEMPKQKSGSRRRSMGAVQPDTYPVSSHLRTDESADG